MKSSRQTEVSHKSSAQHLTSHNTVAELTNAWKSLSQSKAALRHIENRLEATSGTGVLLDSVMDTSKKKTIRTVSNGDGQQANGNGRCSNRRGRSQQNLEKSSSRSPLRNATQDNNVRKNISVEFKEPLASYREATPPPNPSPQLEAFNLKSVPGSSCPSSSPLSDPLLSQLAHQRDTRNKQKDGDLGSIYSSARESTEVHYLNDQPVLVTQRAFGHHTQHKNVIVRGREDAEEESTPKAQPGMDRHDLSPFVVPAVGSIRTPSTSPGSTSQRLENLKRHQHDDKLEKLKERIRRQRQHLEEAAEREKQLDFLEQPFLASQTNNNDGTSNMPKAKIRKVAAAPPAPIYKGFNCSETKIQTPDGKVWKEEEFHKLSRDIYRDLSQQIAESVKSRHQRQKEQRADQSRERRPPKPVRKVHRVDISPDRNTKPVISPASWREGQKLVKMVLGPDLKLPMEDRPQPSTGLNRTASLHRSCSHSRSESKQKSRPRSKERPHGGFRGQSKSHSKTTSTPSSEGRNEAPVGVTTNLLSADIQGILDDLQLECKALEKEESTCQRSRSGSTGRRGRWESGSRRKTPLSAWGTTLAIGGPTRGCRSASPTIYRPATANTTDTGLKKRHYDADAVRQYISRQQEERKRLEAEEKRALKEETEKRNQRLQELYRKQRKIAKPVALASEAILAPVQKRLQETYNKLLLEGAQLDQEATTQAQPAPPLQMRPIYQPSGESDKENKRVAPQSPSSSDGSMNDQQPPPLSRNDLESGCSPLLLPGFPSPAVQPMTVSNSSLPAPFGDHLLSQILRFENAIPASEVLQWPATTTSKNMRLKKSRIESLKATATSLSKSIESEARKLAGEGINYGTATTMDVDTILDPISSQVKLDERCWAEMAATENNGKALKIQRILTSTGLSSFNGSSLPGVESLHAHRGQFEKNGTRTNSTGAQTAAVVAGSILNSYKQERGKSEYHPTNHLEKVERMDNIALGMGNSLIENKNWMDRHDSSSGSISEGPLLSEGSFSEDEASLPHPTSNHSLRPADRLKVVDYCASQRRDHQRLSEFQREAARCLALSSPLGQHDVSKTAWEELNKGSPLSVINIFTKNLHGHVRVSDRNPPSAQSSHSAKDPLDAAAYEDDFVSTHSSRTSDQFERMSNSHSVNSHFVELMRRSPYEKSGGGTNSHHSSIKSPHRSSGSPSGSSPFSSSSARKRGTASDQSDATLVEEQRSSCSPSSEPLSSDSRKRGSDKSSVHRQTNSLQSSDALRGASHKSLELDRKKFKAPRPIQAPPSGSPPESDPSSECGRGGSLGFQQNTSTTVHSGRAEAKTTGELHYSPAVLQQRMAAELHYLESIEESVRQLGDVERMRDVSMAQQESVSLAQMLKTKQQRHERDLHQLKMKAEREALETQQQLEENRQQLARAHIQLQESLTGTQRETLEGLQEAATHMLSQQAEASRYTADAARHIKEMTELARSHIEGAFVVPPVADESSILKLEKHQSFSLPQRQDKVDSDSFQSEMSHRGMSLKEPLSSLNSTSHSESLSSRRPNHSGAGSSSPRSTSQASSGHREQMKKESIEGRFMKGGAEERTEREECSSSIEDEVRTAANESIIIPSIRNDRGDSTSVATEYSVKFDESMTEDEIEERSFRSLLPSEAHRRGSKEKKSRHHEESEDDEAIHDTTLVSGPPSILKDANIAFSGGQDSFSQFTMDMVRQYMKDEEVRLQHQSSLLHLRQKAVKEKTRTELAWLDHQKKSLRDKGEDDKMPPIRKKQRGLLMKLQQEQAEIKRLQEANKAARKERQLLLKQQEEIERMRNSTFRLKERLKFAGAEPQPESSVSESIVSEAVSTNLQDAEDFRSPSPSLSISGSETSSIMQKLKKMRSHMDEKFLTKREQQLMQRRHHAVELLQWKQRLDEEEAEVRKMEKDVLVVWDRQMPQDKGMSGRQKTNTSDISHSPHRRSEPRTESEKEYVSEGNSISATPESSIHTEGLESQQPGSPSPVQATSIPEKSMASIQSSPANYTQDFTSPSQSLSIQSPLKGNHSPATSAFNASIKTEMRLCSSPRSINQPHTQPTNSPMALHTEPISDQSDIESRIKALKEEVRKRKFMAYLLKKEQKKRHKERLKAQEASLLKQLQSYDNFIERTKAELNEKPDGIAQINDSSSLTEQSGVKSLAHRSEPNIISGSDRMEIDASFDDDDTLTQLDHSRSTSVPEELSEDQATITPHPNNGTPACPTSSLQSHLSTESFLRLSSKEAQTEMIGSGEKIMESCKTSRFQEDLEEEGSFKSEDQHSECLLRLEKEDKVDTHEKLSTHEHVSFTKCEEYCYSPCVDQDPDKQTKNIDNSEAEEAVKYGINSSSSFAMDLKTSSHPSCSPSSSDTSCSPGSAALALLENKALIKGVEASARADGYRDDFESSVSPSPSEDHSSRSAFHMSASHTEINGSEKNSPSKALLHYSQDGEVEEEISDELSHHSGISGASHQSGSLLDLHNQTEDSKYVTLSHSPPITPLRPPHSPVIDEMSRFYIGDRVLVGGVQPGTLRFKGPTSFAKGFWAGVELDKCEGSNNGTYDDVVYFECDESHGIFAPPDKVTHLPDKFKMYSSTTENEDLSSDDYQNKGDNKHEAGDEKSPGEGNLNTNKEHTIHEFSGWGDKLTDESGYKATDQINSQHYRESEHPISNGNTKDIIHDFNDPPTTLFVPDINKIGKWRQSQKAITNFDETDEIDPQPQFTPEDLPTGDRYEGEQKERVLLDKFVDKLLNNFVKDTVKQFEEIKKAKEQKIETANQMNGDLFCENHDQQWFSSVEQRDGLPFFLPAEKEELSSPELCNRPESPVLGASGQEKLAKRLAELELSRELLDDLGDDQDWFDEDFGLSSRREQQRLQQKQKREEARVGEAGGLGKSVSSDGATLGGLISSLGGEQQVKTPPRPELPLPLPPKLPEQPAMVVPHSAKEVEKMVHAATQEIWESCGLGKEGALIVAHLTKHKPSQEYLGKEASSNDQEALCVRSYRKAVFDLTWEIIQEIFAEDPNTDQPQWLKPRHVKSSFHRMKTPGDIAKVQEFITAEVLKLYGLKKDQTQKTDWQKMLKFGRKKRDKVDHILVQELHEEEAQWVNYDEDELFVKMQLADSIFDALLKDTANVLTVMYDNRTKTNTLS